MNIIVLLNHQYATGKTTATWHLGRKMAEMGKKVLLIDGDPACGLTRMALGDRFEDAYRDGRRIDNIKKGVRAAFKGKSEGVKAIDCLPLDNEHRLYLLPGHENLSEYEPKLREALDDYSPYSMDKDIPGSFYRLFQQCAKAYDIEEVLLDTGGGLGALNQIFFSICDNYLVPLRPSSFTPGTLKTLRKAVRRWKREAQDYRDIFSDSRYPLPRNNAMRFVGDIVRLSEFGVEGEEMRPQLEGPVFPVPHMSSDEWDKAYERIAFAALRDEE